jgi:hypothetical protein
MMVLERFPASAVGPRQGGRSFDMIEVNANKIVVAQFAVSLP